MTKRSILRALNSIMKALQNSDDIDYETYQSASEYLFPLMSIMKKTYSSKMQKDLKEQGFCRKV